MGNFFKPGKTKIFVFYSGNLVFGHMVQALESAGYIVKIFDYEKEPVTFEDVKKEIEEFHPDICLAQNYYPFDPREKKRKDLEEFLMSKNIKCICWYVDAPLASGSYPQIIRWHAGNYPSSFYFFYCDKLHLPFFSQRNLPASFLPSAADSSLQHFVPTSAARDEFKSDLSFVATVQEIKFEIFDPNEIRRQVIQFFYGDILRQLLQPQVVNSLGLQSENAKDYFSDLLPPIEVFFKSFYGDKDSYNLAFDLLVSKMSKYLPGDFSAFFTIARNRLDTHYSNFQMIAYAQHLQQKGLRVFGKGWKSYLRKGVTKSKFLNQEELYSLYASSKISFCYTKWQCLSAVPERALYAMGAGSLPLCDAREGLFEMFDRSEVVTYSTIEEACDKIDYYLANEAERKSIVEKSRAHLFKEHTFENRVQFITETLNRHYA